MYDELAIGLFLFVLPVGACVLVLLWQLTVVVFALLPGRRPIPRRQPDTRSPVAKQPFCSAVRLIELTADWVTVDLGTAKLRHPPEVLDWVLELRPDQTVRDEVARLTGWFGQSLSFPPTVYLFPPSYGMEEVTDGGGCAFVTLGCTVQPLTNNDQWFRQIIRHELVHLHAYQIAGSRPPLIEEGLATLLDRLTCHRPKDQLPPPKTWRHTVVPPERRWPSPHAMLDRSFFMDKTRRMDCYEAAGNFSAYLVQRHGWDKYLAFYKRGRGWLFFHHFRRTFGVSFVRAEREWRAGRWAVQLPATD